MQPAIVESSKNIDEKVLPSIAIHISFEILLSTIEQLPQQQQWQLYQSLGTKLATMSAEAKAISRLPDEEDPTKWITVIEEDEEIDEQSLNIWLEKEGYPQVNV